MKTQSGVAGVDSLVPGGHACLIYETEDEHREGVVPFLREGLEGGERVIYITYRHEPAEIEGYVVDMGLDPTRLQEQGALVIVRAEDTYLKDGAFAADRMLEEVRALCSVPHPGRFSGVRITGETCWICNGISHREAFFDYESQVGEILKEVGCRGICQYHRPSVEPDDLLKSLQVHPTVLVAGRPLENPHFIRPDELRDRDALTEEVDQKLELLTNRSEMKERYRRIVELSPDGIVVHRDGHIVYANPAMARQLGIDDPAMLEGEALRDLVAPSSRDRLESLDDLYSSRRTRESELIDVELANGRRYSFEVSSAPIHWAGGEARQVVVRDVTDRELRSRQLSESEERFRILVEHAHEAIVLLDAESASFVMANPRTTELYGLAREDLLGRTPFELSPERQPDGSLSSERARERIEEALEEGSASFDWVHRRADGSLIECQVNLVPLPGTDPVLVRGSVVDISERKAAQRRVEESREHLERILRTMTEGLTILDADGRITYANPAAEAVLGLERSEITDRSYDDPAWHITGPKGEHFPEEELPFFRVMESGAPVRGVEHAIEWKDGTRVQLSVDAAPIRGEDGRVEGVVAAVRDVTEEKAARARVDSLLEITRRINANLHVEEILDGLVRESLRLVDAEGGCAGLRERDGLRCQKYIYRDRTLPLEQVWAPGEGLPGWLLEHGRPYVTREAASDPEIVPELQEAFDVRSAVSVPVQAADGRVTAFFELHNKRGGGGFTDEDVAMLEAVAEAASVAVRNARAYEELEETDQLLRETNDTLTALLHAAPVATIAVGPDGRVALWNPEAEELFGWSREEVRGQSLQFLGPHAGDETVDPVEAALSGSRIQNLETTRVRKDGREVPVAVSVAPILDADASIMGALKMCVDLTERRSLESQLLHSQKLDVVGRLAGGVAHDFNNLLTVIRGEVELLLAGDVDEEPVGSALQEIRQAAERATLLTSQLLAFSRQELVQPEIVHLDEHIRGTARMLRRLIGENVELVEDLGEGLPAVLMDRGHLDQILLNLAVNARDAMPHGGPLTVRTRCGEEGEALEGVEETVVLQVSDRGVGMDEATRKRIFEPFFTTKGVGQGTGLGLSTVASIVKQAGGRIEVESAPGAGTTFRVILPPASSGPSRSRDKGEPGIRPAPERSGTILVVEDEDAVRGLVLKILRRAGYDAAEAASADEALDLVAAGQGGVPDLILTDLVLPEMSGQELVLRLREAGAAMPAVFMSGYTHDELIRFDIEREEIDFLQKPFEVEDLLTVVARALR